MYRVQPPWALQGLLLLQTLCASRQGNHGAGKGAGAPIDAGVPTPHQTGVTAIGGTPMQTADVRKNQPDLLHRETDSAPAKACSLQTSTVLASSLERLVRRMLALACACQDDTKRRESPIHCRCMGTVFSRSSEKALLLLHAIGCQQ